MKPPAWLRNTCTACEKRAPQLTAYQLILLCRDCLEAIAWIETTLDKEPARRPHYAQ